MTNENPREVAAVNEVPSMPVLSIEEVRQLEIVRIKSVREGKAPSCTYNFRPSTRNVPDDFLAVLRRRKWKTRMREHGATKIW